MSPEIRSRLVDAEQLADPDERLKAFADAVAPIYSYDAVPSSGDEEKVDAKAQQETWNDMVRLQMEGVYPAAFSSIAVPVLMIHGDYDPHPGSLIRDSLRAHIPQLDYRELEHCGHYPWNEKEAAETFFELVCEWLDQNAPFSARRH